MDSLELMQFERDIAAEMERKTWWLYALMYMPMTLLTLVFWLLIIYNLNGMKAVIAGIAAAGVVFILGGSIGSIIHWEFQSKEWKKEHEWEWD